MGARGWAPRGFLDWGQPGGAADPYPRCWDRMCIGAMHTQLFTCMFLTYGVNTCKNMHSHLHPLGFTALQAHGSFWVPLEGTQHQQHPRQAHILSDLPYVAICGLKMCK